MAAKHKQSKPNRAGGRRAPRPAPTPARAPAGAREVKQQIKTRVEKFGVKAVAKALGIGAKTLTEKLKSKTPARELIPTQKKLDRLTEKVKDANYKTLRATAAQIKKEDRQAQERQAQAREEKEFKRQARAMEARRKAEAREKAKEEKRQAKLKPRAIGDNDTAYYPGGLKQFLDKEGGKTEPHLVKSLETMREATNWANKVTGGIAYFVIIRETDSKGEPIFNIYYVEERVAFNFDEDEEETEDEDEGDSDE